MIPVSDRKTIMQIARRAADINAAIVGPRLDPADVADGIEVVHEEIVRLRLLDMLASAPADLLHDVHGILRFLDIDTNPPTFRQCFVPRFAEYQVSHSA